jgi:dTDP-4-dehydrorhamnose reductase
MIVLLGGSGWVGSAFREALERMRIPFRSVSRASVDYTDAAALARLLQHERPSFLINAAGYVGKPNVDACELNKAACLAANAVLPATIASACAAAGIPWGHVSTGCIYEGTRPDGGGFTEEDPPNFTFRAPRCSFYSGTKALAEEMLAGAPGLYVWRMRIPFNHVDGPRNYLTKLMRYPRLLDATNSLSELDEFVSACLACWRGRAPFGTYNVTNPGHITTREAVDLIRDAGLSTRPFDFFADEAEFMRVAARTPRSNCVMDSRKLAAQGIEMTEVHEAVARALRQWVPASEPPRRNPFTTHGPLTLE